MTIQSAAGPKVNSPCSGLPGAGIVMVVINPEPATTPIAPVSAA
jgi:hypothetical protein